MEGVLLSLAVRLTTLFGRAGFELAGKFVVVDFEVTVFFSTGFSSERFCPEKIGSRKSLGKLASTIFFLMLIAQF